jgi:hypothetical protein
MLYTLHAINVVMQTRILGKNMSWLQPEAIIDSRLLSLGHNHHSLCTVKLSMVENVIHPVLLRKGRAFLSY